MKRINAARPNPIHLVQEYNRDQNQHPEEGPSYLKFWKSRGYQIREITEQEVYDLVMGYNIDEVLQELITPNIDYLEGIIVSIYADALSLLPGIIFISNGLLKMKIESMNTSIPTLLFYIEP